MSEPNHVFVYGTLKRQGGANNRRLRKAEFLSPAILPSHTIHYAGHEGSFPYCFPTNADDSVLGELYKLPTSPADRSATLASLDQLEGFISDGHSQNHYDRCQKMVDTDEGSILAYVYIVNSQLIPQIKAERMQCPVNKQGQRYWPHYD